MFTYLIIACLHHHHHYYYYYLCVCVGSPSTMLFRDETPVVRSIQLLLLT